MRTFLILSLIIVGLSFGLSRVSYAVCVLTGNTPGGGNIINCPAPVQNTPLNTGTNPGTTNLNDEVTVPEGGGIDVPAVAALRTGEGNDVVTVDGGTLIGTNQAIGTATGDDTIIVNDGILTATTGQTLDDFGGNTVITINGGMLTAGLEVIELDNGMNIVTVNGGTLIANNLAVIQLGFEEDTLTVNGGTLDGSNVNNNGPIIETRVGNDIVNLNGGIYLKGIDRVVDLGSGNDMLTFGADIDLGTDGFVDCGNGFDTLVFAMDVPEEAVNFFSSQILSQNPQNGSVVINGITYEWENCELLVPQLNGVREVKPIPTLSQWGLIAMAGVLGMIGLLAIRRRKVAA